MGVPSFISGLVRDGPQTPTEEGSRRTRCAPPCPNPTPSPLLPQPSPCLNFSSARSSSQIPPSPLHGMQFGAPPLKIIHLKSVLSLTSSSVHEVVRRPVLQHSSLLRSVLYRTWQRPFRACRSQQFPAAGGGTHTHTQPDQWQSPLTQTQHVRLAMTFTRLFTFICPIS